MLSDKQTVWALVMLTVLVVFSYIDSLYIYPNLLKSGKNLQNQCTTHPEQCWIQEKNNVGTVPVH